MREVSNNRLPVVVGVIKQPDGKILLSKRCADTHQGGLWEFPGGKCEMGETFSQALCRELKEELDIEATDHRPLISIKHDYPDRSILLKAYTVTHWHGKICGKQNQTTRWILPGDLPHYAMPAANKPLVHSVQLPSSYSITPAKINNPTLFLNQLDYAIQQGLKLLQFRVFGLTNKQYLDLLNQTQEKCMAANVQLMLNADLSLARQVKVDGLHLNHHQLALQKKRPPRFNWLAASCHTPSELHHASAIGADFAVLSPVLATPSHPGASPLGWKQFAEIIDSATMPVYALGGMYAGLMQTAWNYGAQGIAGIRSFWSNHFVDEITR